MPRTPKPPPPPPPPIVPMAWREFSGQFGAGLACALSPQVRATIVPVVDDMGHDRAPRVVGYQLFVNGAQESIFLRETLARAAAIAEGLLRKRYPQCFRPAAAAAENSARKGPSSHA